jgi:LytS/YehU family sensor histidine kinase
MTKPYSISTLTDPSSVTGRYLRQLALIWLAMLVLAVGLTVITPFTLKDNLVYSLVISGSIFVLSVALETLRGVRRKDWTTAIIAIPVGTGIGVFLSAQITGHDLMQLFAEHPNHLVMTLVISLACGTGFSFYFQSRETLAQAKAALREQALARIEDEKRLLESNLRLLQAQIEPHFLFNTLSNILSLIRDEPDKAERMLHDLTEYLRVSLQRTREAEVTLGDEIRLLRAYLGIQQVRMGERLRYSIEVPEELYPLRLPPLLIQPLAENAVRHGLESQPAGGEVSVSARRTADQLDIEIADTGPGMAQSFAPGVGIANVRARLQGLYGDAAKFVLQPNTPHGLRIRISIPVGSDKP